MNVSVNLSVKVTVDDRHLTVDWPLMTECGLSAPLSFDQSERCSLVNPNTGRVERSRRLASELSVNVSVNLSVKVTVGDQHLTSDARTPFSRGVGPFSRGVGPCTWRR